MGCFQQALLALAHLRKNETLAQLGAGFGISEATAWRYVDETISVLAAWAPGLREALTGRGEDDFVVLDGTLIPTDRVAADEPYYSQKHRKHGPRRSRSADAPSTAIEAFVTGVCERAAASSPDAPNRSPLHPHTAFRLRRALSSRSKSGFVPRLLWTE